MHQLSQPSAAWTGSKGRISEAVCRQALPPAVVGDDRSLLLLCGPDGMQSAAHSFAAAMGYEAGDVLTF